MTIRRIPALGFALLAASCFAQKPPRPSQQVRLTPVTFPSAKPILGLPLDHISALGCTGDNLTYFTSPVPDTGLATLYSVSQTGEVKRILRSTPVEFNVVTALDFFPAERNLVTLVKAEKRDPDNGGQVKPARETAFYLALAPHDGSSASFLPLDIHFKPLRIAAFGSGEYLLLGWDEANLLPVLAVLKEDGSVRTFMDFDSETSKHHEDITLAVLQGAVFVPFGGSIMITHPRTTRPIRMLSQFGPGSTLQLALPAGYVLHKVVEGSGFGGIIAQVEMSADLRSSLGNQAASYPTQRLFEFSPYDGSQRQEFTFAKHSPADITCAAGQNLTALFLDTVASPDDPQARVTQWMAGGFRR